MRLEDIIKNMGFCISEVELLPDFLLHKYNQRCVFVDKFPLCVSAEFGTKFDELDVFYQETKKSRRKYKQYLYIEQKYTNFFLKLWLYSTVYVNTNFVIPHASNVRFSDVIAKKRLISNLKLKNTHHEMLEINKSDSMKSLIKLSIRDIANVIFYFKQYGILAFPTFSCFLLYLHDESQLEILEKIALSEGLFIRKPLESNHLK